MREGEGVSGRKLGIAYRSRESSGANGSPNTRDIDAELIEQKGKYIREFGNVRAQCGADPVAGIRAGAKKNGPSGTGSRLQTRGHFPRMSRIDAAIVFTVSVFANPGTPSSRR